MSDNNVSAKVAFYTGLRWSFVRIYIYQMKVHHKGEISAFKTYTLYPTEQNSKQWMIIQQVIMKIVSNFLKMLQKLDVLYRIQVFHTEMQVRQVVLVLEFKISHRFVTSNEGLFKSYQNSISWRKFLLSRYKNLRIV